MFTGLVDAYGRLETSVVRWLQHYAVRLLTISIGIVFLWFGVLKFFAGLSPAEQLAGRTIEALSFGAVPAPTAVLILAAWETLIGLGMLIGMAKRATLALLLLQMAGTMTPLVLFPQETFALAPIVPNLEGQYIIKNLVIISGALVIAATLRGAVLTQKALPGAAVRDEVGPDAGRGNLGQSCSDPKTVGC